MLFQLAIVCWICIFPILKRQAEGVNSASIKSATEYHAIRMQKQIEDNYQLLVESNEQYSLCDVFNLCNDPPTLYNDDSVEIDGWLTSGTPYHNPQCNESEVLIGVKPNNHNPKTGEPLTSDTCPQSNPFIACNYDNSNINAGIKIPYDADTDSQEFLDATCFANELEEISTTRIYSNCHTDEECYILELGDSININNITMVDELIDTTEIYCNDYGICSNTQTPEIGSFAPQYVENQYYGDQRTGVLLNFPAKYWDPLDLNTCPGTYDPRFRPWYVKCTYNAQYVG